MSTAERLRPRDPGPSTRFVDPDAAPAVHPAAFVDADACLGAGVEVGPGAIVEHGAVIGEGARVLAHAFIGAGTVVGRYAEVHMGAVVGHAPQIRGFVGPAGSVVIGARTVVREHATIHRASLADAITHVGDDCFIMAGAHVAHDCHLAEGVTLANGALLAGHVSVGAHAFISGNVVVHQFVRVGPRCLIGGQAAVVKDVPPFVLVAGRSRVHGLNVVGLRRAGYSRAERQRIRAAYRTLYCQGLRVSEAVAVIRELGEYPDVRVWLDFLSGSSRGYCRPRRPVRLRPRGLKARTA